MIHASIRKALINKFSPQLQEGNLYIIKNIKIIPAQATYRPVINDKKNIFLLTTIVTKLNTESINICRYHFELADMQTISRRCNDNTYLIGRTTFGIVYTNFIAYFYNKLYILKF